MPAECGDNAPLNRRPWVRPVHKAETVKVRGPILPLCAVTPINLRRESWTLIPSFVTCDKCLALMAAAGDLAKQEGE